MLSKMHLNENMVHGSAQFPFTYFMVDKDHDMYVMPAHWHSEAEIIKVNSGLLELTADNKTIILKAGEYAFINLGVIYSAIPQNNCEYECMVFDLSLFLHERSAANCFLHSLISLNRTIKLDLQSKSATINRAIKTTLSKTFYTLSHPVRGFERRTIGLIYLFLSLIEEVDLFDDDGLSHSFSQNKIKQFKVVISYIQKKYMYQITLNDLSSILELAPSSEIKFFKEMTPKTPMDYIKAYRVE